MNQEKLEELNKKIKACNICPLRKGCTQVVPGEGNSEAEIMFIGEGPGQKEDELGRPFVGAAGKFLDEMLAMINLNRGDACPAQSKKETAALASKNHKTFENKALGGIFIANVVKCRPPLNRDPLPEEVAACWPWLLEQIKFIRPRLIVTLGRHSLERFLPNQKISQIHGRALRREIPEIGSQVFYALYHPAAALYNGSMREVLIKDFKKIPKVLKALENSSEENDLAKEIEKKPEQTVLL